MLQKNTTVRFAVSRTMCLKWTRDGRYLFTASKRGTFKLTDMEYQNNTLASEKCTCHFNCYITCCSFYPYSDLLLVGCSEGAFSVYYPEKDKSMTLLYYQQDFDGPITAVEFSCDGKHFAVASVTGNVAVYVTMSKKLLLFIKMEGPTRALCWHPWDRTCLVVADCFGNMNLYNVLASQELKASYKSIYNMPIVCLAFNPLSGELVVSHRLHGTLDDEPYQSTQLNVLASFDRVVDRLEGHTGRVLCMNWSPDSTRLATCGSDETARIWPFLSQRKKHQATQRESESSYTSTVIKLGDRMGLSLR